MPTSHEFTLEVLHAYAAARAHCCPADRFTAGRAVVPGRAVQACCLETSTHLRRRRLLEVDRRHPHFGRWSVAVVLGDVAGSGWRTDRPQSEDVARVQAPARNRRAVHAGWQV